MSEAPLIALEDITRVYRVGSEEVRALDGVSFEVGRGEVGKGGVVRDPAKHREVIHGVQALAESLSLEVCGVTESPILGPKGNREFLIYLRKASTSLATA